MRIARDFGLSTALMITLAACGDGGGGGETPEPVDPPVTGPTVRGVAPATRIVTTLGEDPRRFSFEIDVAAFDVVFAASGSEPDTVTPVAVSGLSTESFPLSVPNGNVFVATEVSYALDAVSCGVRGQDGASDVFLLFDRSFSVGATIGSLSQAGDSFADNLGAGDRGAIGQFSGQINDGALDILTGSAGAPFTDSGSAIRAAVDDLESVSSGSSPLFDALIASFGTPDAPTFDRGDEAARAVVLISDDATDTSSDALLSFTFGSQADEAQAGGPPSVEAEAAASGVSLHLASFPDGASAPFERVALDGGGSVWATNDLNQFARYGSAIGALVGGDTIVCTAEVTATLNTAEDEDFPLEDLGFGPGTQSSSKAPFDLLYTIEGEDFIAVDQIVVPFFPGARIGAVENSGSAVFQFDQEATVSACLGEAENGERENICTFPIYVRVCDETNACAFEGGLAPGDVVAFDEGDVAAVCRDEPVDADTYRPARLSGGEAPDQSFDVWTPFPNGGGADGDPETAEPVVCLFSERF